MLATTLATGIAALLLLAAWNDIATRLIPDAIPLAIAALAIALRLPAGLLPTLYSGLVAGLVFAALLGLAMRGWLGGGDVKLAAALALALPPFAVWDFVTSTTFCGGALALPYIAFARLRPAVPVVAAAAQPRGKTGLLTRISRAEARRLRQGGPLPYAVAIAAGGIITLHAMIG